MEILHVLYVLGVAEKVIFGGRACKHKEVNAGEYIRRGEEYRLYRRSHLTQLTQRRKETVTTCCNNCVYKVYCAKSIMNPFNCRCISMEYWSHCMELDTGAAVTIV